MINNTLVTTNILNLGAKAILVLVLFLSGCVSAPVGTPTNPRSAPESTEPAMPGSSASDSATSDSVTNLPSKPVPERRAQPVTKPVEIDRERPSGAANQVLAQADSLARRKQYDQALLLLDRAQRMSPQAGEVYLQMAQVKYDLDEYNKAEQLCLKAVALSGTDSFFRKKSLQTLAIVREGKGDSAGAAAARKLAAAL